jgi:hypothetical protein
MVLTDTAKFRSQRSKNRKQSLRLLTAIPQANKFSDAAGNTSATVLEQVGRGASKAARLNKDGHLIKDYYDLPQTSALIGAPGHNSFYQTPDFYSFFLLTTTTFSVSPSAHPTP